MNLLRFRWFCTALLPSVSAVVPSHIERGENVLGAILFFSYILAALYFTVYIVLTIFRVPARHQAPPKLSYGKNSSGDGEDADRPGRARHHEASRICCSLALISFAVLSWNMLNFLIVSYSKWALSRECPTTFSLRSFDKIRHGLQCIWRWATGSNLFQTFAEDLVRDSGQWKVVRAALVYSYTWNSWMSALG